MASVPLPAVILMALIVRAGDAAASSRALAEDLAARLEPVDGFDRAVVELQIP